VAAVRAFDADAKEVAMKIEKPRRIYTVEPVRSPVPAEPAKTPPAEPRRPAPAK
jgi:hypothetical protein